MGSLYESYVEMLKNAKKFREEHDIHVTGVNFKANDRGLLIPSNLLEDFSYLLIQTDAMIEEEKAIQLMSTTNSKVSIAAVETLKPVKSSESDESAFYFPFGRD